MAFKIQLCCSRREGETKKRKDGSKAPHKALKYLKPNCLSSVLISATNQVCDLGKCIQSLCTSFPLLKNGNDSTYFKGVLVRSH